MAESVVEAVSITGSTCICQRSKCFFGAHLDEMEQSARWTSWVPPPLFPVPQRANVHVDDAREFLLRQPRSPANLANLHGADMELAGRYLITLQDLIGLGHASHQFGKDGLVHLRTRLLEGTPALRGRMR